MQCGRRDRGQSRWALASGAAGAMRRMQAPAATAMNYRSIISADIRPRSTLSGTNDRSGALGGSQRA